MVLVLSRPFKMPRQDAYRVTGKRAGPPAPDPRAAGCITSCAVERLATGSALREQPPAWHHDLADRRRPATPAPIDLGCRRLRLRNRASWRIPEAVAMGLRCSLGASSNNQRHG